MFQIKAFEKSDIDRVIAFERELRIQEPDTYYWDPDETYRKQLEQSFEDQRFNIGKEKPSRFRAATEKRVNPLQIPRRESFMKRQVRSITG